MGGPTDKIKLAIGRLRSFEPTEGYYLAFSGGKDSCILKQLAIESGVKFDTHYSVTTIDPPELTKFIRQFHPDVIWERPPTPFLKRVIKKGMPRRQARWCCEEYKERGGTGRLVLTGIRWAESPRRSSRKMVEHCIKDKSKRFVHPIIDWSGEDVWGFIKDRKLPYCSLYDEGWKRIGCIFCPMQTTKNKQREVERYPKFVRAFQMAFQSLKENRESRNMHSCDRWPNGKAMFEWYISGKAAPKQPEAVERIMMADNE
jgi:phosphoadenosine phosphosulfate reductase